MKWLERFGQYRIDDTGKDDSPHDLEQTFDTYMCSTDEIFIPKLTDSGVFSEDWSVIGDTDLQRLMDSPYCTNGNSIYISEESLDDIFSD